MRGGDRLWRDVTGMPVVLMSRVQDTTKVSHTVGTHERGAIHHPGNILKPLRYFNIIDSSIDRRKSTEDLFGRQADLKRVIALGVERFGTGHSPSHP